MTLRTPLRTLPERQQTPMQTGVRTPLRTLRTPCVRTPHTPPCAAALR
jgi:hypothetical protein